MKGIILAGGHGTRLYPMTKAVSKQLLPVYDKPMIYYPLSMLMLAGIREILIISTPQDLPLFRRILGDGQSWGLRFSYFQQEKPNGIAEAIKIGKDFIGDDTVCLVLGDNIFYGTSLPNRLGRTSELQHGAVIFGYRVSDPSHYAVATFESETGEVGKVTSLEEKPEIPKSNFAVPGLYFYDNRVTALVEKVVPSPRGELEITDLNRIYLEEGTLQIEVLGRGIAWLDAGRPETLLQAAHFIQMVQERQGLMVSCPEEIALRRGYIDIQQMEQLIAAMGINEYRFYLEGVLKDFPN